MKTLTFSAILSPTFTDQLGEMMRTLARVALKRVHQTLRHRPRAIDVALPEFGN
jgi:hypothetical protein